MSTEQVTADSTGSAVKTFNAPSECQQTQPGTYTAVITDPDTGDSASASHTKNPIGGGDSGGDSGGDIGGGGDPNADQGELQCDPPRTQLEAEKCAGAG